MTHLKVQSRRTRLAAYLLVVAVVVFGFWRVDRNADNIAREAEDRRVAICEAGNRALMQAHEGTKEAITRLVATIIAFSTDEGEEPNDQAIRFGDRVLADLNEPLKLEDCPTVEDP